MNSGGELNVSIIRLIRSECARTEPEKIEPCVEAVTQKTEEDLKKLCGTPNFRKCQSRLGSGVWRPLVKNEVEDFGKKIAAQKREEEKAKILSPIIWEQPLAIVDDETTHSKFKFTHVDEWRKVETKITDTSLEWSYFLTKNADGSLTVRWRKEGKEEQSLIFNLVNGFYPSNLMLAIQEDQNIQLILK